VNIRFAVLTVSDRSSRGERPDASGPAVIARVEQEGWVVTGRQVLPDDLTILRQALMDWSERADVDIVLTTGGTGFAPRDVTPEATREVMEREAPGLAEAMRALSSVRSPHAMLSRAVAGIRRSVLIINLPGSPRGAVENFEAVLPALEHAVQLLHEDPQAESRHSKL